MISARSLVLFLSALCLALPLSATNLVTGNGFGFAVVAPDTATITKFYAHPYSFTRPDPRNPLSEGMETTNFLKSLQWRDPSAHNASAEYEQDSHVIHLRSSAGEGFVSMPFGLRQSVLLLSWQPASSQSGAWSVTWNHPVQSHRTVELSGTTVDVLHFAGVEESLVLIPLAPRHDATSATTSSAQPLASSSAWALLSLENEADLASSVAAFNQWRAALTPRALVQREIAQLESWRVPPPPHLADNALHLWRQSEVMLRIAQSREPNRPDRHSNGLLVASLPDGVWFTPWVRDMAWAAVAFTCMGHQAEARAALLAYFNAQPTGKMRAQTAGADYQVSVVRYFGDGSEEPFFTQEGSTNIEYDDWGEVLWLLGQYLHKYNDPALLQTKTYRGPLYASARDFIVKPLLANLEPCGSGLIVAADTSIWEERQKDKKHFAFSTAMAIVGLKEFAQVAHRAGDETTRTNLLAKIALLQKGFNTAFIRDGHLHGTLEPGVKTTSTARSSPSSTTASSLIPPSSAIPSPAWNSSKSLPAATAASAAPTPTPPSSSIGTSARNFSSSTYPSPKLIEASDAPRKPSPSCSASHKRPPPITTSFPKCMWLCPARSSPATSAIPPAHDPWSATEPEPTSSTRSQCPPHPDRRYSSATGNARNSFASGKPCAARHTTDAAATRCFPIASRTKARFTTSL
ncbi:MAG: hypothetical protein WAN28_04900, partial [Terracidiphilus sp.]